MIRFIKRVINYLKRKLITEPKYVRLMKKRREAINKSGFKAIEEIQKCLNKLDLIYFVDFGTLLGMIREQGFIGHDLDIDIGVILKGSTKKDVKEALTKVMGAQLYAEYLYKGEVVENSYKYEELKFDINFYKNDKKNSKCWLMYQKEKKHYEKDIMDVVEIIHTKTEGTKSIEVKGHKIMAPLNPEKLLEEKNRATWKIPNRNWIYWKILSAVSVS